MNVHEIRDPDAARRFLVQGIWLQQVVAPAADNIRSALEWSLAIAAGGQPLPPVGFVADLGHILLGSDRERAGRNPRGNVPGLPAGLARTYEDLVLGKLFIDRGIERAGDVVRRYEGRDRARAVAFVVNQLRERAGVGGVMLSPSILKGLLEAPADELLARGWDGLSRGLEPLPRELYEELIAAVRRTADVLGPEDIFELEHGTALAELGQRVALRQVLQTAARLEAGLPRHRPRLRSTRREVPTQVPDEDVYPVGGFASISTRGTIESLLHSQLAFMEPATAARPDLFDVKFVRDELLYYSRDENQFLRLRRTFVVVLTPDLVAARFKDVDLPTQRIVLTLALLVVAVRRLTDWLSSDALVFDVLFVADGETQPLDQEESLMGLLLREAIANGTVRLVRTANLGHAAKVVAERARQSLCQTLLVSASEVPPLGDAADVSRLVVAGPRPRVTFADGEPPPPEPDAWLSWEIALGRLLEHWA
jgi:hypothetical protein